MALFNTRDSYGVVVITLHWLLFILVAGMVVSGKYSASLDDKNFALLNTHKQVGMAIFALMSFRLLWRLINTSPFSLTENFLFRMLAFFVHWLMYLVVLGQVWIGVVMTQLAFRKVVFLNFYEVPNIKDTATDLLPHVPDFLFTTTTAAMQMRELHYWGAALIVALVAFHILGALSHHYLFGDDTLRRMFYGYVPDYAKNIFKSDNMTGKKKKS